MSDKQETLELSIVVAVTGGRPILGSCLTALEAQTSGIAAEILVIDARNRGPQLVVRRTPDPCEFFNFPRNLRCPCCGKPVSKRRGAESSPCWWIPAYQAETGYSKYFKRTKQTVPLLGVPLTSPRRWARWTPQFTFAATAATCLRLPRLCSMIFRATTVLTNARRWPGCRTR